MSSAVRKGELADLKPASTNWFDLPFEMREMVIDNMDPRTRCKFAQCSKMCEKEVKGSRNHLIAIRIMDRAYKEVHIGYNQSEFHYCLRFLKKRGKKGLMSDVFYTKIFPSGKPYICPKWAKKEHGKPEDVRKKWIRELIDKYKKSIRKIIIKDENDTFSLADIDIKCLRNLEYIENRSEADSMDVLSTGFMSIEQIYRTNFVFLPATKVTYEDIRKFKGAVYCVKSDDFKEEQIGEYLKMMKNGEVQRNVEYVRVIMENNEGFNGRRITEGLDMLDYKEGVDICGFSFNLNYQVLGKKGVCRVCYATHQISMDQITQHGSEIETSSASWFDLPAEMREMVINKMDPKTLCKFAQCSKICEEEAKRSENYLYSIRVQTRDNVLQLEIFHIGYTGGYCLEFIDSKHGETIVVYRSLHKLVKWMKLESGTPRNVRAKYAKEYIDNFKNSITTFIFDNDYEILGDININNLRKLTEILFYIMPDDYGSISKFENKFIKIKKLLQLERIYMDRVRFTFDQIVNFKGKVAVMATHEFSEENIRKYLKMWKNGKIDENVKCVDIIFNDLGDVNLRNITKRLDVYNYEEMIDYCEYRFFSKSTIEGNRSFYVKLISYYLLHVEWREPV